MSSKCPWIGQSLSIQICPSRSTIWALISPTFSVTKTDTSWSPRRIASRASITQFGQRESVVRGQPRVGLVFCQDFNSGLSDHFGVKDGFGLYLLTTWIVLKSQPAAPARPRSKCLIGFIVRIVRTAPMELYTKSTKPQPQCSCRRRRDLSKIVYDQAN